MVAQDLLRHFESLAKRPEMFVGVVSFFTVRSYLHGLAEGLRFAGVTYTPEQYEFAANSHGYDPRGSIGILRDFRAKGLSDQQMVEALITVEAAAYRVALGAT